MRRHLSRPPAILAAGLSAWPFLTYSLVDRFGIGGCVRTVGVRGFLAEHVAMLTEVTNCPAGTVGMARPLEAVLGFLLIAAFASVLVQVAIAVMGSQAANAIHAFAEYVARLVTPIIQFAFAPGRFGRVAPAARELPARAEHHLRVGESRGPPSAQVI